MTDIKRNAAPGMGRTEGVGKATVTFYCVLYIDRFSNRVLVSVFKERKSAEAFRTRSPRKLFIEPEEVSGYSGEDTLWCSNERGPGDVLSFIRLHADYGEAAASSPKGLPCSVIIADAEGIYPD